VLTCGYLEDADPEGVVAVILRKLNPRETRLVTLTAVVLAVVIGLRLRGTAGSSGTAGKPSAEAKLDEIPRIDLKRVDAPPRDSKAGERDIFEFGRVPEPEATPPPVTMSTPVPMANLEPTPPPVPTLPPLNLKYIGSLDNSRGLRVAVLVTERNEILTGKVGEVVANRYKIGKIGFESVDLEDVTSGQTRRIALRAK
jgi:hypothetical protein